MDFDEFRKRIDKQQERMTFATRFGVFMALVWVSGWVSILVFVGYVILRILNHFGI